MTKPKTKTNPKIKILKPIFSEKTEVGIGAEVHLKNASCVLIDLLRSSYLHDSNSISGDVFELFTLRRKTKTQAGQEWILGKRE